MSLHPTVSASAEPSFTPRTGRQHRPGDFGLRPNWGGADWGGGGLSRQDRLGMMRFLRKKLVVGLAMVDYRGFGGSDGSPTEAGLLRDGAAALHWLAGRIPPGDKIVLHCESIGERPP